MLIKTLIFIEDIPGSLALAISREETTGVALFRLPSRHRPDACSRRLVYFNYTSSKQMIRRAQRTGINRVTRFGSNARKMKNAGKSHSRARTRTCARRGPAVRKILLTINT